MLGLRVVPIPLEQLVQLVEGGVFHLEAQDLDVSLVQPPNLTPHCFLHLFVYQPTLSGEHHELELTLLQFFAGHRVLQIVQCLRKLLSSLVHALLDDVQLDVVFGDLVLGHLVVEAHAQGHFRKHLVLAEVSDDVHGLGLVLDVFQIEIHGLMHFDRFYNRVTLLVYV